MGQAAMFFLYLTNRDPIQSRAWLQLEGKEEGDTSDVKDHEKKAMYAKT